MNRFLSSLVAGSLLAGAVLAFKGVTPTAAFEGKAPLMVSFTRSEVDRTPREEGHAVRGAVRRPQEGGVHADAQSSGRNGQPAHTHSSELKNVIISGVWYTGADAASAKDFGPGSIVMMPANWAHVSGCRAGSECVFYQEGKGKFDFKPVTK